MGAVPPNQHHAQRCSEPEHLKFTAYHGTSYDAARDIARSGFKPSKDGRLGPGVYVAKEDKARRFAENHARHGGDDGVLIKTEVTVRNPKFLRGGDAKGGSYAEHDAIRTNWTGSSPNPEWVIRNATSVKPVEMTRVPTKRSSKKTWCACASPGCGFQINDNPAYRNVKPQREWKYCCELCRHTGGAAHGGWCQHKRHQS